VIAIATWQNAGQLGKAKNTTMSPSCSPARSRALPPDRRAGRSRDLRGGAHRNVGALDQHEGLNGMALGLGRKSLAGSMIGGIAETQEVVDYCAAHNIKADVELIRPKDINRAYERVVNKDVRYRIVIDMVSKATG